MSLTRNSDLKPFRDVRPEDFSSEEAVRIEMPKEVLGIDFSQFWKGSPDYNRFQLRIARSTKTGYSGHENWTRGGRKTLYTDTGGSLCFALGDNEYDLSFMIIRPDNFFNGFPIDLIHLGKSDRKDEGTFIMTQLQRYSQHLESKNEFGGRLDGFKDDRFLMALYIDWGLSLGVENILSIPAERVALIQGDLYKSSKRDALRRKYNGNATHLGMNPVYSQHDGLPAYFWLPKNYSPSRHIKKDFFR